MVGIIYKYTNPLNGKSYIGKTFHPEQRKKCHARNKKFKGYNYQIIDSAIDTDALNFLEQHYIQLHETHISTGKGYNLTFGGDGGKTKGMTGYKHSAATRKQMKLASPKIKPWMPIVTRKMGLANKGSKRGSFPERNIKIGNALRGRSKLKIICFNCGYHCDAANMKRWHESRCKGAKNGNSDQS